ncbi:MAG TPA: LysR substrate-binding domain-containing protein [Candidatus Acidoferrum sp.]|nr:LysR substrate-binding domain-containing protein [Candidatus Acidoferrum sp.]
MSKLARAVSGKSPEPRGQLVVTAPVFRRMHIAPIVSGLLRAHSALNARLELTDRLTRLVDEGIDVAVRIAELTGSALHAIKIADVRRIGVASPAYLNEHGTPREIANLHDHSLVAFDSFASVGEWRFANPHNQVIRFVPRLLTNSIEATIDAALNGLGIARVLSYQVARHLKERKLVRLFQVLEPTPIPVNLVFQSNRQRSPNVRALVDATKRYFRR